MTTKPSDAPWADEPYQLLTRPSTYLKDTSHSAVYCADTMVLIHNVLIRGLNAIVQQAPHVKPENQRDVLDLLYFTEQWTRMVEHHHETEEEVFFPELEKMADKPDLMSGSRDEHEAFHAGLVKLQEYAVDCQQKPEKYRWANMKLIIDAFGPVFRHHLAEEIDVLLKLDQFDSKAVRKCWDAADNYAKKSTMSSLHDLFPLTLGCADKTFEGGNTFPPVPGFIPYLAQYWWGKKHAGAWRFSPCDYFGKPRPLTMLPQNEEWF